jgi:hypothetical protein
LIAQIGRLHTGAYHPGKIVELPPTKMRLHLLHSSRKILRRQPCAKDRIQVGSAG